MHVAENAAELPDALQPIAGLLGAWEGTGEGHYPTIDPFGYTELVRFEHVGKPFLEYRQRTRALDDGRPLHTETGYLRPTAPDQLEFLVVQPTGFAEVHAGSLVDGVLDLALVALTRAPTAKDVRSVRRRFVLDGDVLSYDLWMALGDLPEQHHLRAQLRRAV